MIHGRHRRRRIAAVMILVLLMFCQNVLSVNADEDEALAAKYGVRNIPATLAVKVETDEVVGRLAGIQSEENLIKFVKETLNK